MRCWSERLSKACQGFASFALAKITPHPQNIRNEKKFWRISQDSRHMSTRTPARHSSTSSNGFRRAENRPRRCSGQLKRHERRRRETVDKVLARSLLNMLLPEGNTRLSHLIRNPSAAASFSHGLRAQQRRRGLSSQAICSIKARWCIDIK